MTRAQIPVLSVTCLCAASADEINMHKNAKAPIAWLFDMHDNDVV